MSRWLTFAQSGQVGFCAPGIGYRCVALVSEVV
jgi:hypothetical protein